MCYGKSPIREKAEEDKPQSYGAPSENILSVRARGEQQFRHELPLDPTVSEGPLRLAPTQGVRGF